MEVIAAHRGAVYGEGAAADIGEAGNQIHQRGLARTGGAHNGHGLAGVDVQIDVAQHRLAVEVQIHAGEVDFALHAALELFGLGPGGDGGLGIVQLDDLVGAGEEPLQVVQVHAQHAHGVGQRPGQAVEQGEGADGDAPGDEERAAHQQHRDGQGLGQALDVGAVLQPQQRGLGVGFFIVGVLLIEALDFVVLPGKGLYHPVAGDVLLGLGIQQGEALPQVYVQGVHTLGERQGKAEDDGRYRQHGQGKEPVCHQEHNGGGDKQHRAVDELPQHPGHGKAHHVQVAGQAGHQVAGAGFGEEILVLLLHVLVQIPAELENQLLRAALVGHDGQVLEAGAEQGEPNEQRHQENEVLEHLLGDHAAFLQRGKHRVHNHGGDGGVAQSQHRQQRGGAQGEDVPLAEAFHLFPHPL